MNHAKTIAILGASAQRHKYGNIAVRAWRDRGFAVYPVNPAQESIEGLPCYRSILDIPGEVEIASVYLPPEITLKVLPSIAQKGVKEVFLNPGSENAAVLQKARELGLNVIQACSIVAAGKSPADYPLS
ncbi:MAG: CoA-binding protein [Candidatus Omnitrophota bacterium]